MDRKTKSHFGAKIAAALTMVFASSSALAGGLLAVEFDATNFTNPRVLDNPYWPLLPGGVPTTFIYLGDAEIDGVEVECPSIDDVPLGSPIEGWDSEELFLECTGGSWEAGQLGQEEGKITGEAGIVVPGDFPLGMCCWLYLPK